MSNKNLKFVFFGTSDFAVTILDELRENNMLPALIVTMPDKPAGRGMQLTASPVKKWAGQNNVLYTQPEKLDEHFADEFKNTNWDVFVVAAYGKIIPEAFLNIPTHETLNVHPSLLPHHRGPAPIEGQILADDLTDVGVSIMLVDEKMDHGPLLAQTQITPEEWPLPASELEKMLAHEGGVLLAHLLPEWVSGKINTVSQEHGEATFTKFIKKEDAEIDLENGDLYQNYLKICAYDKNPVAYFFTDKGKRVKITKAGFANGKLKIEKVVPEGKKEMDYENYLKQNL